MLLKYIYFVIKVSSMSLNYDEKDSPSQSFFTSSSKLQDIEKCLKIILEQNSI